MSRLHLQRNVLRFVGGLWGDQREYLLCEEHGGEFAWDDDAPEVCPVCGGELLVHTPHAEMLSLRWQMWCSRWFPHRLYGGGRWNSNREPPYKVWRWRGRDIYKKYYKEER